MIKTVKTKKQMRLDELIKYVWDNDVQNEMFRSKESDMLVLVEHGRVFSEWTIDKYETFTVEVEEDITEDTEFEAFVVITDKRVIKSINNYHNMRAVRGLLENYEVEQKVYALIDNDLELIWEAE